MKRMGMMNNVIYKCDSCNYRRRGDNTCKYISEIKRCIEEVGGIHSGYVSCTWSGHPTWFEDLGYSNDLTVSHIVISRISHDINPEEEDVIGYRSVQSDPIFVVVVGTE
jgi:hypothetical protein